MALYDKEEVQDLRELIIKPHTIGRSIRGSLDLIGSHLGFIHVDLEFAVKLGGTFQRQQRNNFLKVYSLLQKGLQLLLAKSRTPYDIVLIS